MKKNTFLLFLSMGIISIFLTILFAKLLTDVVFFIILLVLTIIIAFVLSSVMLKPLRVIKDSISSNKFPASLLSRKDDWGILASDFHHQHNQLHKIKIALKTSNDDLRKREADVRKFAIQLDNSFRKLQTLDTQKDEFLCIASHELRTPLTVIKTRGQLLLSTANKKEVQQHVGIINRNVTKLSSLIDLIIDSSRIALGKIAIIREPISLQKVLDTTKKNLSPLFKEKKIKLSFSIAKSFPLALANHDRLMQVLNLLLENALKFTEKGSVSVNVTKTAKMAVFEIKDTGIGIEKKYHKKIFNRFFQVEEILRRKNTGSGLGLFVAKEVVKHFHGKMWIQSTPKKGSSFFFSIPLATKKQIDQSKKGVVFGESIYSTNFIEKKQEKKFG